MMNRLRRKLTAFNTAITGAILVGMTILGLFLSERNARAAALRNFSDTLGTASAYVDSQNQISVSALRRIESAGRVRIFIRDGGTPLFSMSAGEALPELEQARRELGLDLENDRLRGSWVIPLDGKDGGFYAGLSLIPKEGRSLELILLYPLEELEGGIRRQRLAVGLAALAAVALLALFSWHFTGKLLRPIQENQLRQYQFTAAASHELRTPLAAILSATSAWERAECVEPESKGMFSDIIRREGKRMTRLIGDLLTLAGADCQSWELHLEEVEPDMLLLETYETYLPLAKEKGLKLSLDLPDRDGPPVRGDVDRLMQVLSILLDNALDYTPAPGDVRLGLTYGRTAARITVADTGPGVPEGQKKQIFQRFHRGERSRSGHAHFGLGLAIAAELVRLHRGKIWVEDGTPRGAVFHVELPS